MNWLVRLAVLNLLRNRWRTALSLGAVVVGVAALIIGKGFVSGLTENLVRAQIDTSSGHVVVRPAGYPTQGLMYPIDGLFPVDPGMAPWFDEVSEAWTTRVVFSPTATAGPDALRVRAIGYDTVRDAAVFPRESWGVDGALPGADEVLVSQGVQRLLGVDVGGTLTLQVRTPAGAINALALRVSGVLAAGNPYLDRLTVLLTHETAASLLQSEGAVSHVILRQSSRSDSGAHALAAEVRGRFTPEQEVVTWVEETQGVRDLQRVRQRGLDLLVVVLLGMSAAGIANTVLMAAYERTREVGTLRAMGMNERAVLALFLAEGTMLGVVGGALGAAAGAAVVLWFNEHGIDLSVPLEKGSSGHVPLGTMLYPEVDLTWLVVAPLLGAVTSALASVYPARVAARMAPAEAVRA